MTRRDLTSASIPVCKAISRKLAKSCTRPLLQVIFCSRTHSQLSQFVAELRRTPFADSMALVALASRKVAPMPCNLTACFCRVQHAMLRSVSQALQYRHVCVISMLGSISHRLAHFSTLTLGLSLPLPLETIDAQQFS